MTPPSSPSQRRRQDGEAEPLDQAAWVNTPAWLKGRYLRRALGLAFYFLMVASVLVVRDMPWTYWVAPFFHGFLWAPLCLLYTRRSRTQQSYFNVQLASQAIGGLWLALMGFNLLPCALLISTQAMQCYSVGGGRLLVKGLLLQGLGTVVGVFVFGWYFQPDASVLTVLACLPMVVLLPWMVAASSVRALREVSEQRELLRYVSQHDGLSGLMNRQHWDSHVQAAFERFQKTGETAVLVMIDIDHFKRINDSHGHGKGDEVIRGFAAAMRGVVRQGDACARYGGEEFGILLPSTPVTTAKAVVVRLQAKLHEMPLLAEQVVTASFGVVEVGRSITSVDHWHRLADEMLYRAKHAGRDQIAVLGSESVTGTVPVPLPLV